MECLSRSKLFKADKNKILECINGLKSQFFKKAIFKQIWGRQYYNFKVTLFPYVMSYK
jgi:hypothetical protein